MNDNDIIKALECCSTNGGGGCTRCPAYNYGSQKCVDELHLQAINLINRQKAEIERLQKHNSKMARKHYNNGIADFVKNLVRRAVKRTEYDKGGWYSTVHVVYAEDVHDLAKEMTEGEDAQD